MTLTQNGCCAFSNCVCSVLCRHHSVVLASCRATDISPALLHISIAWQLHVTAAFTGFINLGGFDCVSFAGSAFNFSCSGCTFSVAVCALLTAALHFCCC